MKTLSIPTEVRANSPEDLYVEVQKYVSSGFDLHTPTVVMDGELVAWVVPYYSNLSYVLVYKNTLDEFVKEVKRLSGKGYDFVFGSFEFKDMKCQWMAKEFTSYALPIEDASAFAKPVMLEEALSALKVVVGVQKIPSFQILLGGAS